MSISAFSLSVALSVLQVAAIRGEHKQTCRVYDEHVTEQCPQAVGALKKLRERVEECSF